MSKRFRIENWKLRIAPLEHDHISTRTASSMTQFQILNSQFSISFLP